MQILKLLIPTPGHKDLVRTCPVCLLDRQFPENLLFGQAKISMKNFQLLRLLSGTYFRLRDQGVLADIGTLQMIVYNLKSIGNWGWTRFPSNYFVK